MLLLILAAAAATRLRLRRLGNQVEPRASRAGYDARRRVALRCDGTPGGRERMRGVKAAIFREGNQQRAFRVAYYRATPPLPTPTLTFFFLLLSVLFLLATLHDDDDDDDHLIVSLSFLASIRPVPGALSAVRHSDGLDG